MSFAVIHMQKFKANGVKGIQFHNQREQESKTNPDIYKSKSHLNYDLHNKVNIDFNKTVKEKIENNVITNRAIRKDAVFMCNFVVTSDKKFFDGLTDQQQKKFFEKSYEFFKDRYGEKNIVSANIHLDEKTPHMHLSLVPVTEDHKLSAKRLFDCKELRSLQDHFPKYIKEHGFDLERGIDVEGKNKHIETQKFKVMEIENKVKDLEQQRDSIQSDLKAIKSDFEKVKRVKARFDKVNSIEGKYGLLNKNKVTTKTSDFEELKDIAKRQHVLERKIEGLEYDNESMKSDIRKFNQSSNKAFDKTYNLEKKLNEYKKEYGYVVNYLKDTDQVDKAKDYVKEQR